MICSVLLLGLFVLVQSNTHFVTTTITQTRTVQPKILAQKTQIPSDPHVKFKLDCQFDSVYCNKVSRVVAAAINEFTRVIYIKNNLLIHVKYYNFCKEKCANETYGRGIPSSQFTLPFEDGADLNYVYPQALAKQLAPYSSTSVWSKYDIEIEINHDLYMNATELEQAIINGWDKKAVPPNGKFWLLSDSEPIQSHQIDLRYIVLHQLLHGLGFVSSWAGYFWTSPLSKLLNGIDPDQLKIVTPSPYWFIQSNGGPVYATGFQPTMIFDKFLECDLPNRTRALAEIGLDMQDFCVQTAQDAFIMHFIQRFQQTPPATTAHQLWRALSDPQTLHFRFQPPLLASSKFNSIPHLQQYQHMTLLTGPHVFDEANFLRMEPQLDRAGLMVFDLDSQYFNTTDFLMTQTYHQGKTLEDLTALFYKSIPSLEGYRSPIGPGILRILDSIGYSTVLTKTDYISTSPKNRVKSSFVCDESNSNTGIMTVSTSDGPTLKVKILVSFPFFVIAVLFVVPPLIN